MFRRSKALIVSVSEFAARDVERRFGIPPQSVAVVPNAAEHMRTVAADPDALGRLGLQPGGYVLVVGGRSGRKNFHLAEAGLQAVPAPRPTLVLVDGGPQRAFSARTVAVSPDRLHLREITDATLKALYQNALCLVFPSRYEGFGLPPLEAMSCGCPVIASDAASLPEVCGDAALYCDPDRPETVSALIGELLADPALRRRLISAGLERSKVYSWDASANSLLATALRVGSRQR